MNQKSNSIFTKNRSYKIFAIGLLSLCIPVAMAKIPPPGKLYDVSGYKMHLDCRGDNKGQPTIILEAGGGDFSATWGLVQDQLAQHTHVCSYDRTGFGWSDAANPDHSPSKVAKQLHTLLQAAEVHPPYLMVSHSIGALYVQTYTALYPQDVQGVVLVDPAHEEFIERLKDKGNLSHAVSLSSGQKILYRIGKAFPFLARMYAKSSLKRVPEPLQQTYREEMLSSKHLRTAINDVFQAEQYYKEAQQYDGDLGDRPLIILGSTHFERPPKLTDAEYETFLELFAGMQKEIAQRSTQSHLIFVQDSGHMVQWEQPQVVIDNILSLLN